MAIAKVVNRSEKFFNKVDNAYHALQKRFGARLVDQMFSLKETSEETTYTFELAAPQDGHIAWKLEVSKDSNMDANADEMLGCTYSYNIKVTTEEKECYMHDSWHKSFAYINKQFGEDLSVWKSLLAGMKK